MKKQLFFFCLLYSATSLLGQEYILDIQHYGIEEGLSHRDVHTIHQDKHSILWLGTSYGLNRFDGYRFKWYTKETHGLQSNWITYILEDVHGNLWLFDTDSNFSYKIRSVELFNTSEEKSYRFEDFFADNLPFSIKDILAFTSNSKGHLAFLTNDQHISIYDGQWTKIRLQASAYTQAFELRWATNDWIWLATDEAEKDLNQNRMLQAFDLKGKQQQELRHNEVNAIHIREIDDDGTCHYSLSYNNADSTALYILSPDKKLKADHSFDNPRFEAFLRSFHFQQGWPHTYVKKGPYYLISVDVSLYLFTEQEMIDAENNPELKKIRADANFHTDPSGKIWAINPFGVYNIQLEESKFNQLLHNPEGAKFATRNLSTDNADQLWAVQEGIRQLWKVDLQDGTMSSINQSRYVQDKIPIDQMFSALIKNRNGQLLFATPHKLTTFDPISLHYQETDIAPNDSTIVGVIWALYEDKVGKIWYSSSKGNIGFWDKVQSNWMVVLDSIRPPTYGYQFYEDKEGLFWLATDSGLFLLNNKTGKVEKRYWSGGKGELAFPFDHIHHIHEDKDGTFWLGTAGTGLIRWNKGKPLLQESLGIHDEVSPILYEQYTRAHGLNNVIYAVYEDEYGYLWLSSDNGIIRFHKTTQQLKTYLKTDGITHHEFNRISHHQAEDGRLFFGGLNGVTAFHPRDFAADSVFNDIPLVITDFQIFDKEGHTSSERNLQAISEKSLRLQPNDRFFRLEFALLTYEEVDKNLYAYKVEGVDQDWTYQKENFIRFSRLPYGHHKLRIKGQGVDGQWSMNELTIQLTIVRPFYLQFWFFLTSIMALIGGIVFFFRSRTTRLKRQKKELQTEVNRQTKEIRQQAEELKSLEKLKSRFFANVSHELRTPLTLMLGPMGNLLKRDYWHEKDKQLLQFVNKNGRHLLKLVNEILDLSKLETDRLEVKETNINFYEYLQPLVAQFSSFGDSERVHLNFDYQLPKGLHIRLDTDKFEKIVHNFLSNALKFTPSKGQVDLVAKETVDHQLLIEVRDTGRGIHPDDLPHVFDRFYQSKQADAPTQGGTGIGLSLCLELAELLNGKVWAESNLGIGSTFYFRFPKAEATPTGEQEKEVRSQDSRVIPSNELDSSFVPEVISSSKTEVVPSDRKPVILLVEDNMDLRTYMKSFLGETYHIITAENGKVAWDRLCNKLVPDLIISDLMMPVMDGFQLLEKVKGRDTLRHLPVIMLTARADVKVKLKALRIGVDDYLTKPFLEEELLVRIANLLKYSESRKKHSVEDDTASTGIKKAIISEIDANWLAEVEVIFSKKLNDSQFKIDWVASQLHLSQSQFTRRLKKLTGLTPNRYLREMRLNIAKDFLLSGKYATIKETCYAIGLRDAEYFSNRFQERFGVRPSEYAS